MREDLLSLIEDPHAPIAQRRACLWQLLEEEKPECTLPFLAGQVLQEPDERFCASLVRGLGSLGVRAGEVLLALVADQLVSLPIRIAAVQGLSSINCQAAIPLLFALGTRSTTVAELRVAAVEALGAMPEGPGECWFLEVMGGAGPVELRAAAMIALGLKGTCASVAPLSAALKASEDADLRRAAAEALWLLLERGVKIDCELLLFAIRDTFPAVRVCAIRGLALLAAPPATDLRICTALCEALEDPNNLVRYTAVEVCAALTWLVPPEFLLPCLSDRSVYVADAARRAFKNQAADIALPLTRRQMASLVAMEIDREE